MARRQSEILGLFATPMQAQQMAQERISQGAQRFTDPIAQQMYQSGAQLATGVGGLFGAKTPEAMQAETIQQLQQDVPFDPNNQEAYYNTLAQRLIDQNMYAAGYEALDLGRQAKKVALDDTLANIKQQELDIKLQKLNNPQTLSIKEQGDLAKDFTPASVKAAVTANDVSLLKYKGDPASSNYVVLERTIGTDRNGQPITEPYLVDKNKVAELTGGQAVVPAASLMGGQVTPTVTPAPNVAPEAVEQLVQPATATGAELPDLPGVPGMTPEKNIETRQKILNRTQQARSLISDVFDPSLKDVVGRTNILTREAAKTTGSDLAPLASRLEKGALVRAAEIAKQLGTNPTDRDFQASLQSSPTPNDPPNVWKDWTENTFVPALFNLLDATYGPNSAEANQYKQLIQEELTQSKARSVTPARTASTSSGTRYTVREK